MFLKLIKNVELALYFYHFFIVGSDHPPVIVQGPINQTVSADSLIVMRCKTTSPPSSKVHWKKDGAPLSSGDPRLSVTDTGTLQIHHAKVGGEVAERG